MEAEAARVPYVPSASLSAFGPSTGGVGLEPVQQDRSVDTPGHGEMEGDPDRD